MPRTVLPPTPASSTDIEGQDGTKQLQQLQMTFELPPPAVNSRPASSHASNNMDIPGSPESPASPKTPYPIQASEAVKSRRRSSAATAGKKDNSFALPPPPTRTRRIIQMKPRPQDEKGSVEEPAGGKGSIGSAKGAATTPAMTEAAPSPAKKKQPPTTSAAGRKIARKTAHSLIERRRRSKMNEEFSVLKGMIPACVGDMHKLAILQASIEYVRYLQDCIEKLKAQREASQTPTEVSGAYPDEEQHPPDVEMAGSDATPSPSSTAYQQPPASSPVLAAQGPARRHGSYSSVSTADAAADHRWYYSHGSAATSPASGPQAGGYGAGYAPSSYSASGGSTLTSPALDPLGDRDLDQEATAALLMLNIDRRGTVSGTSGGTNAGVGGTGRGMSVRDLLSA